MLNISGSIVARKTWTGVGQGTPDFIGCHMYNPLTREKLQAYLNHLNSGPGHLSPY